MAPRRPAELYRAPFPLYTVRLHPHRPLAITAGGGGAAKTGIRNGVVRLRRGRGLGGGTGVSGGWARGPTQAVAGDSGGGGGRREARRRQRAGAMRAAPMCGVVGVDVRQ